MALTLIGLHGFTLNGALMRETLAPLVARLPEDVVVECPDGTRPCEEASVLRMQQLFGVTTPAPHQCWFDSSADGLEYRGFERTKETVAALAEASVHPVGLLGFSQGAICAAALTALSAHGQFPKLDFVVLVAGRTPRAADIAPLFERPLTVPSLHVWGQRDVITGPHSESLVGRFDVATRRVVQWSGSHTIPTRGEGADAIVEFIRERNAITR